MLLDVSARHVLLFYDHPQITTATRPSSGHSTYAAASPHPFAATSACSGAATSTNHVWMPFFHPDPRQRSDESNTDASVAGPAAKFLFSIAPAIASSQSEETKTETGGAPHSGHSEGSHGHVTELAPLENDRSRNLEVQTSLQAVHVADGQLLPSLCSALLNIATDNILCSR